MNMCFSQRFDFIFICSLEFHAHKTNSRERCEIAVHDRVNENLLNNLKFHANLHFSVALLLLPLVGCLNADET